MITFKTYLSETFNQMGDLSDDELKKGQVLKGDSDDFAEVDARVFLQAIKKIKINDIAKGKKDAKGLESLSVYAASEYKKMRCFLGKNNSSGYALKKHDLVSVFSTKGSSARSLMAHAIKNGAKTLDCFADRVKGIISGSLYDLYSKNGFKIDKSMNSGKKGEPYAIVDGVSDYVDDNDVVHPEDKRVVIFMKHS